MHVPWVDLERSHARLSAEAAAAFRSCIEHGWLVGGPPVTALEEDLRATFGAAHAVACASGTAALMLALQACGVRPGDRVALPDLTFFATCEAVLALGAVPVLVDVDPLDLALDLGALRRAHEAHRPRAVILVHLFGWASARLAELRAFARERELILVEDAAQAAGVEVSGRSVLADADVATLSFYPTKVLGGAMDGGAVLARQREVADAARRLADHGRVGKFIHGDVGWNARMAGAGAAFLRVALRHWQETLSARRATLAAYREELATSRVRLYGPPAGVVGNGYLAPITVEGVTGQALSAALAARGVETGRIYPRTISEQPAVRGTATILADEPRNARAFCRAVVDLPLFYGLRDDERAHVVHALRSEAE